MLKPNMYFRKTKNKQTIAGYFLPWINWVHESRVLYLVVYIFVFVEGKRAAEAENQSCQMFCV